MKKIILQSIVILVAFCFSSKTNAQQFTVVNNTSVDVTINYCLFSSGTVTANNMVSLPWTPCSTLSCTVDVLFASPCNLVTVSLNTACGSCPSLGTTYSCTASSSVSNCPLAITSFQITFNYDSSSDNIDISVDP